ncbi:GvpL/GvpF family gas vesicle protein [Streptomyces sp. ODS05-4]|uniref:GvpL/GvpF family gas vesicle protein n=1 Tax=Streptomyces sp. ODS05-4 TaxID=2944939 RepID=UPI00210B0F32|nr:GvpL/GvpF family gas vesicle protein [Streptomyces sp. ODS05-4]
MSGELVYVYGVAAAGSGLVETVPALRGVGGEGVRVVEDSGLAAVVGPVAAADFEQAPLAAHLEDLAWLEAVARAHHEVVDAVAAAGPVLPLRLATVYRDEDAVRALLAEGRAVFAPRLEKLAGQVEWGVKVHLAPTVPAAPPAGEPARAAGPGSAGAGRAYLRARGHERRSREGAYREAAAAVAEVRAAAAAYATEQVRHRVQQGALAGGGPENIANDAFLVPSDSCAAFLTAVRRAAESLPAVRVEITGPWAPYSFAALDDAVPAPGGGAAAGP